MPGSAFGAIIPLRYINAARAAAPNPSGLVVVLHILLIPCQRIPAKAGTQLLPSAALVAIPPSRGVPAGRGGVFPYAHELPLLYRSNPTLRALTTPFRSVGLTMAPQAPPSSVRSATVVVRSPNRTSNTTAQLKTENFKLRLSVARHPPTKRRFRYPSRPMPAAPLPYESLTPYIN